MIEEFHVNSAPASAAHWHGSVREVLRGVYEQSCDGREATLKPRRRDQLFCADERWQGPSVTGFGIPGEALPRVFDRFFCVDLLQSQDSGGNGLA